jgi:hypothetical protein
MPYAVKCFPARDAGVILCKDEEELAHVNADVVVGLHFGFLEVMAFDLESAIWIGSEAPTLYHFPITIYRLTEEEYEKWQKAF